MKILPSYLVRRVLEAVIYVRKNTFAALTLLMPPTLHWVVHSRLLRVINLLSFSVKGGVPQTRPYQWCPESLGARVTPCVGDGQTDREGTRAKLFLWMSRTMLQGAIRWALDWGYQVHRAAS